MLKAFIDESAPANGSGRFVMGGLVAFAHHWDSLADAWSVVLNKRPPVPFFRMSSFRSPEWRSEHGITAVEANTKSDELASLFTCPPLLFSVCCSVDQSMFRQRVVRSGILKKAGRLGGLWLKTPYAYCFHQVVSLVLRQIVSELKIEGDVVDFIFDKNDPLFDAANEMLRELRDQGLPKAPSWANTLGDAIPGNDEKVEPLQMADMLAGRLKDHCLRPHDATIARKLLALSGTGDNNITFHAQQKQVEELIGSIERGVFL